MKAITLVLFAIAAFTGIDAATADEARAVEVIVVTAERVETPATKLTIAAEVAAPSIDFSQLTIQAPTLDPATTRESQKRIELAIGSRDVSQS